MFPTVLLVVLLLLMLTAVVAFYWWDIIVPRKLKRVERQRRRENRRKAKLRFRILMFFLNLRKTRRLTDQRAAIFGGEDRVGLSD